MASRILVAYTTKKGSTAEIAQAVGKDLKSAGYDVGVHEMAAVQSVEGYDAIVLGAPFYMHSAYGIEKFVKKFCRDTISKPVAVFGVGMAPVSNKPGEVDEEMKILNKSVASCRPVSVVLFAGKVDPSKFNFIVRKMIEADKTVVGDFRNWDAIAAWTRDLPEKMGL